VNVAQALNLMIHLPHLPAAAVTMKLIAARTSLTTEQRAFITLRAFSVHSPSLEKREY
jgi:hypothetical protein